MFVEAKKNLAKIKTNVEKKGVVLQDKILEGNPRELISNFANQSKNKVDLIVMGSRGRGGLKEAFLGSVSNYVMHKSKVINQFFCSKPYPMITVTIPIRRRVLLMRHI